MGAVLASLGQVAAAGLSIGSLVVEMRAIESSSSRYESSSSSSSSPSSRSESPERRQTNNDNNNNNNNEAALCKSSTRAMQNAHNYDDAARVHLLKAATTTTTSNRIASSHQQQFTKISQQQQKCSLRLVSNNKSSRQPTQSNNTNDIKSATSVVNRNLSIDVSAQRDFITNAAMTTTQNVRVLSAPAASKSQARVNVTMPMQQQNKRADDDNDESLQRRQRPQQQQQCKVVVKRKHLLNSTNNQNSSSRHHHHLHQQVSAHNKSNISNSNNNDKDNTDNTWHRLSLSSSDCLSSASCDSSTTASCSATCCCCSNHQHHSSTINDSIDSNTLVTINDCDHHSSLSSLFATSCHISTNKNTKIKTQNNNNKPNAITMNVMSAINNSNNNSSKTIRKRDIIIQQPAAADNTILLTNTKNKNNHIINNGTINISSNHLNKPQHLSKTKQNHHPKPVIKQAKLERTTQINNNNNSRQKQQQISKPNLLVETQSNNTNKMITRKQRLKTRSSLQTSESSSLLSSMSTTQDTTGEQFSHIKNHLTSMNLWLKALQDEASSSTASQQQLLTPPMSPLLPVIAQNQLIQDSTYFSINHQQHNLNTLTPPPTSPSSTSSLFNNNNNQSSSNESSPSKRAARLAHLMEPPPRPWLQVTTNKLKPSSGKRASLGGSSDSLMALNNNNGLPSSSLSPHKLRRLKSGRHHSIDCGITTTATTPTLPQNEPKEAAKCQSTTTTTNEFTALSYNVLSDRLVRSDRYPCSPEAALNWLYRRELILQQLLEFSPDILALQELEMEQFVDYFEPTLSSSRHAYAGVFESKSRARTMDLQMRKRVDGCAIFYKRDRFKLIASHLLEFNQLAMANARGSEAMLNRVMTKDNIALVAVLELLKPDSDIECSQQQQQQPELLIICNTHIYWDPEYCDVKLVQTIMLMNELKSIAQHYQQQQSSQNQPALVLLGDFNSLPRSGVTNYLLDGQIDSTHEDFKHFQYTKCTNSLVARALAQASSSPEVANSILAPPVRRPALMRTASNNEQQQPKITPPPINSNNLPADVMIDCHPPPPPPTQISNLLRRQSSPMVVASSNSSSTAPLTTTCSPVVVVNEECVDINVDDSSDRPILYEHPFKLQSAYGMGGASMMPFTNYTTKFKATIDYIFYAHDSLEPTGLLGPLDKRWLRGNKIKGFPQLHLPSDHLPLLVKFRFLVAGNGSKNSLTQVDIMPTPMAPTSRTALSNKRRPVSCCDLPQTTGSSANYLKRLIAANGGLGDNNDDTTSLSSSSSHVSATAIISGGDQLIGSKKQEKQKENLLFSTQSQKEKQTKLRKQQLSKKTNCNNNTDEADKQFNFNNQQQQQPQQQPQQPQQQLRPTQRRLNVSSSTLICDYQHANHSHGLSSPPTLWAGSYASASKLASNQQRDLHNNRPPKRHQLFRSQQQVQHLNQHQQQQRSRIWLKSWSESTTSLSSSSSSSAVLIKQHSERWS